MARRQRGTSSPGTRFLTTRESAERLGVTVNALKAWIREQRLPALRTPGGHHRIAENDLIAFQARLAENSRAPVSTRPRILVVDDDEALLSALKEALGGAIPDAVVQTATDGYEALMQVGAFRPDVLVLDIRMPRLDGFEVCRRLKAGRETASVRILAMTAYPEGQVRERIRQCGADDFLEKPFAIEKFRSRVMALLGKDARA
jgi:excisionase family DNA binding protein